MTQDVIRNIKYMLRFETNGAQSWTCETAALIKNILCFHYISRGGGKGKVMSVIKQELVCLCPKDSYVDLKITNSLQMSQGIPQR